MDWFTRGWTFHHTYTAVWTAIVVAVALLSVWEEWRYNKMDGGSHRQGKGGGA